MRQLPHVFANFLAVTDKIQLKAWVIPLIIIDPFEIIFRTKTQKKDSRLSNVLGYPKSTVCAEALFVVILHS
jgi:hypothetical protein